MADRIEGNQNPRRLIGSNMRRPGVKPRTGDLFVANVGEKGICGRHERLPLLPR